MISEGHHDLHECDHDCSCFWCRVSRRGHFETIIDVMAVTGDPPADDQAGEDE